MLRAPGCAAAIRTRVEGSRVGALHGVAMLLLATARGVHASAQPAAWQMQAQNPQQAAEHTSRSFMARCAFTTDNCWTQSCVTSYVAARAMHSISRSTNVTAREDRGSRHNRGRLCRRTLRRRDNKDAGAKICRHLLRLRLPAQDASWCRAGQKADPLRRPFPRSMSFASLTLAARYELPPESGWLAIMMRRCASCAAGMLKIRYLGLAINRACPAKLLF